MCKGKGNLRDSQNRERNRAVAAIYLASLSDRCEMACPYGGEAWCLGLADHDRSDPNHATHALATRRASGYEEESMKLLC